MTGRDGIFIMTGHWNCWAYEEDNGKLKAVAI